MNEQWVPVARKPRRHKFGISFLSDVVLVTYRARNRSFVRLGYMDGNRWKLVGKSGTPDVVAWMPLPDPYKGEQNE